MEQASPAEPAISSIGLGGSCHWCTEAIFQSLRGVQEVRQGWLTPPGVEDFSEGVVVRFDAEVITLATLVAVHLYTHSCTANHSMRHKYRSAVYASSPGLAAQAQAAITQLQAEFERPIITQVLSFGAFRENTEEYRNYYVQDPEKPFCRTFIHPKLQIIRQRFGAYVAAESRTGASGK
ncbi:peptide-methionine (S)-S-oxide reductase [Actimicrobium sp. GrIS 1.19]|uniref:peptide-methionine (S)-S-oxide reductase n=1 Tax=Actimicrobium sp. GrIS 1.19 TaxID=3071708 RepID=UPI002E099A09|nr:peptide-methionine (S)-S-oxide reductase [Actimicrobium sp. GrIS 1.19]